MIASLPMYDWPGLRPATDAFWALIRDHLAAAGVTAPRALDREAGLWETWLAPGLVVSQTCGMPYRTRLHGKVDLIGTPDLGLPDCPPGHYNSVLVVRAGATGRLADFREGTLAFNGQDSQSGWAAPQNHAARHGFAFSRTLHTGAHAQSAAAVASGLADIAGIDAHTWRQVQREMPEVASALRVLEATEPTPGLPYITARGGPVAALRRAIRAAIDARPDNQRRLLGIQALIEVPAEAYLAIPTPPPPSQDAAAN